MQQRYDFFPNRDFFFIFCVIFIVSCHAAQGVQTSQPSRHGFIPVNVMIITLCLLILVYTLTGRSIESLLTKVRESKLAKHVLRIAKWIKKYALRTGRIAARPLLQLYFVLRDEKTTLADKTLIYGCLVYVVMPHSLIPRKIYKLLGLTDEAMALMMVLQRMNSRITEQINEKTDRVLNEWFGTEADGEGKDNQQGKGENR